MIIAQFLERLGNNEVFVAISGICGIVGLIITIGVNAKTTNIGKILKQNVATTQYNRERMGFKKMFEGHRQSINVDNIRSEKLLKDILMNVEEYRVKFKDILPLREKIMIIFFVRLLKKKNEKVNYNAVSNYLALMSGRLSKREKEKHG